MKIAVLIDNCHLANWQTRVLDNIKYTEELIVYNCTSKIPTRRKITHLLYYVLNLFTIRNRLTRLVSITSQSKKISKRIDFEAEQEGAWQRLPAALLQQIASDAPAVVLKFGLGLLRVPGAHELAVPILSYHHGDPAFYRGRPAGFYELLEGRQIMGQIVQRLSNSLDAGDIMAFCESKVFAHSYRATLIDAYAKSPLLINRAIAGAIDKTPLDHASAGQIYRLPSNATVLRFCWRMAKALTRRLLYGAFTEKIWEVSVAPLPSKGLLEGECAIPSRVEWRTLPRPKGYRFLADPFFAPNGALLVEALRSSTGKGEILEIGSGGVLSLSDPTCHYSYPATVDDAGVSYVVPEVAFWSCPIIFKRTGSHLERVGELDIAGKPHLIDPTFVHYDGNLYLFANGLQEGPGVLRLWRAPSLFDRFEEHPASPVRISPDGSRMAGSILLSTPTPLRLGQQWQEEYGNGLIVFQIDELSPSAYRESLVRRVQLDAVKGPHTLNFSEGIAVFDWYQERFSAGAGWRRIRGRTQKAVHPARRTLHQKNG